MVTIRGGRGVWRWRRVVQDRKEWRKISGEAQSGLILQRDGLGHREL